ncbi:hypothetical protein HaLaN_16103 [Haematococcus lacustris]|uniref:Uncharacterized protein n=1 Tax=Haematococcus lacustris TaxID=44745 RepID=A0A699ZBU0_HAELA|nr:hypothetical protein HaLaN_16103 [Haematococcus lacustris]
MKADSDAHASHVGDPSLLCSSHEQHNGIAKEVEEMATQNIVAARSCITGSMILLPRRVKWQARTGRHAACGHRLCHVRTGPGSRRTPEAAWLTATLRHQRVSNSMLTSERRAEVPEAGKGIQHLQPCSPAMLAT